MAALQDSAGALARVLPVHRIVLFGSTAANRHDVGSDVDVLVIYDDPPRDDAFAATKRALAVPRVEPHVYSTSEYAQRRAVVDSMIRTGIEIELSACE